VENELRIDAPKGVLTAGIRQSLAEQKQAILTLLSPPAPITAAFTVPESPSEITMETLVVMVGDKPTSQHGGDISRRLYQYLQDCPEEWRTHLLNGLNEGKFQLTRATEAARRVAQKDFDGAKRILDVQRFRPEGERKRVEPSDKDIVSVDIPSPSPPIAAVPTIPEPDQREKELDALIDQLRPLNRHWKIEWAREKKVPMKALLHAATLWLSDDTDDWFAAANTIFQFTSPFGNKQLCYPCSEKVAIPELSIKK
jgi:hypothetical protein